MAVTGLGVVSALGIGVPAFWERLVAGQSGVGRISRFDPTGYLAQVAAEVPGFDPCAYFDETEREMLDPFAQFAIVAADEAWKQAGLELSEEGQDRAGVAIGSGMGGVVTQDHRYEGLYRRGLTRAHPFSIPRIMNNAAASHVSMRHRTARTGLVDRQRVRGRRTCDRRSGRDDSRRPRGRHGRRRRRRADRARRRPRAGRRCACSRRRTTAIRRARAVRSAAIGSGWYSAKAPASSCSNRGSTRRARGAAILAELAGYGATSDAGHLTQPGVHAPARAIAIALDAGRARARRHPVRERARHRRRG